MQTGGTTSVLTGGTTSASSGGTAVTATGGTGAVGPTNSVTLLTGGYYQMSTTFGGYCYTAHDSVSTITPPCGTAAGAVCFTPSTGLCASGTIAQDNTSYANWGIAVGCNLSQSQTIANDPAHPISVPAGASVHVTLSANASSTLPASLRIQVGDGTNEYCGTLTLTGGSGTVALSSLQVSCWDTTLNGAKFTSSTQAVHVQVQALSNQTSSQAFNFCISALTIS
jgi:hypothetical protein